MSNAVPFKKSKQFLDRYNKILDNKSLEKVEKLKDDIEKYLAQGNIDFESEFILALCYQLLDQKKKAEEIVVRILKNISEKSDLYVEGKIILSILATEKGNPKEAYNILEGLEKMTDKKDLQAQVLVYKILALANLHKYAEMIENINTLCKLFNIGCDLSINNEELINIMSLHYTSDLPFHVIRRAKSYLDGLEYMKKNNLEDTVKTLKKYIPAQLFVEVYPMLEKNNEFPEGIFLFNIIVKEKEPEKLLELSTNIGKLRKENKLPKVLFRVTSEETGVFV